MIDSEPIRHVVIAGGGSAGWMAAAGLARQLRGTGIAITLVESEEIGTIGVGEATVPPIQHFNQILGVDEVAFVKATQGTFKLGIEFVDWWRKGHRYFHPFGRYGDDFGLVPFHQQWLAARARGDTSPIDDYCLATRAALENRFAIPENGPQSVFATYGYAYQFDAGLYARLLRQLAEAAGVTRIEGKIVRVEQHPETGFVEALHLERGERVAGNLFIDCTGFRGLLIGDAVGSRYLDYRHWLPCDRAIAVPSARTAPLTPFTRATALESGWQWRIPLQHRTGNGHVYCSGFLDDQDAEDRLLGNLDAEALDAPRRLRFMTGRREHIWEKNVVSLGLSSGFIEPLESTSLYLVQSGIIRLVRLFPGRDFNPIVRAEYNRAMAAEFDWIRDFLVLHYTATERDDTPFWRHCAAIPRPDSLAEQIDLFRSTGRLFADAEDIFHAPSWLAVLMGQGIAPRGRDTLADAVPAAERSDILRAMRSIIANTAQAMPAHDQTVARRFGAPPPA
ncbi:MAG: tryptophan halogenase family protein [Sphingomonas sp.]|uniref:tryptophan halogenase family protein n=1 Tax=Sphingomonas sp. TaxID=28214 RepID=UPI003F7E9C37